MTVPRQTSRESEIQSLKDSLEFIDLSQESEEVACVSTGVLAFDLAIGGGFPESRFSEIFGDWQSGKSLVVYQAIASCQRMGGLAILYDSERAFHKKWAQTLGINTDELLLDTPESLEAAFTSIEKAVKHVRENTERFAEAPCLIAFDSLAATVAKDELDKPFGKAEMGLRARVISSALRKLTNLIADQRVVFIMVNQMRSKIGVMFGPTEESTGGRAPKFHAGVRIAMKKGKKIYDKERTRVLGTTGEMEVVKSKIGVPFKKVQFELFVKSGIPKLSGMLDFLVCEGVVTRPSNLWFDFDGRRFRKSEFAELWNEKHEELTRRVAEGYTTPEAPPEETITDTE